MSQIQKASPRAEELLAKTKSEKGKKILEEEREFEFYNLEEPGMTVRFVFGSTKNMKKYCFWHGQKYTLPVSVADHVESRELPIWNWRPDGLGGLQKELSGWKSRFQMREIRS